MLLKPLYTEKSMKDASLKRFTFVADPKARKGEAKRMVENMFKVKVLKIQTIMMSGKVKRVGKLRLPVKQSPWKKVIVTTDQDITLFSKEAK
ncbi:MAG: 50S ribosomal protein L23 [Patescibacteria group bacterium]